jgi:hypothetical protein
MQRGYWKLYVDHVNQASEGAESRSFSAASSNKE